jgi:hypothetical protein
MRRALEAMASWRRRARGPAVCGGAVAAMVALLLTAATPLAAQRAAVELRLPPRAALSAEGPLVRGVNMLADRELRGLLANGFPVRLHYRVELWSAGGWSNDLRATTEWDVVVRYDQLDRKYEVARLTGDMVTILGRFAEFADAEQAVERPFRATLRPPRRGQRSYYNVEIDVETLSMSDLDEVERWLRGELKPAVRGQRNPGTAVTRGVKTLMVRLLGGENRHYEVRSTTFRP